MDQTTIDRALLGDPAAAKACTEAGVAIPSLERVEYPAFREDDPFKTRFGDPFPEFKAIDPIKTGDEENDDT